MVIADTICKPTNVRTALAAVVEEATRLQGQIEKDISIADVAAFGPRVQDVRSGMIYVYRAWNDLITSVQTRMPLTSVSAVMITLAGTLMKVSMDLAANSSETIHPSFADHLLPSAESGQSDSGEEESD